MAPIVTHQNNASLEITLGAGDTILLHTGTRCLGHALWLLRASGAKLKVFDEAAKCWVKVTNIMRSGGAPKSFVIQGTPECNPA
jgi:hypothetical protein